MSKVRIIPCLDMLDGRVVKGVNFVNIVDAGDPSEIAKRYCEQGADEIVFLDIAATVEGRKTFISMIEKAAKAVTIPLAVGGGIASVEDFERILSVGASKVSINSAAVKNPQLITECSEKFGKSKVVVAIDTKTHDDGTTTVVISGGNIDTGMDVVEWARTAEKLGAGELLVTSMSTDGAKCGFDNITLAAINKAVNIPVVASGGAGKVSDFVDAVKIGGCEAVLAAGVFHFGEITIRQVKDACKNAGIEVSE